MQMRLKSLLMTLLAMPLLSFGANPFNMPVGVTPVSREIYHLHMTIFWICVAIGVVVFAVMLYALIFHRKSRGAVAADFHEHSLLEILWAIVPFLILVAMAIPATRVLMDMDNTDDSDLTIKITGYQWKWQYEYLDKGVSYFSVLSTPYEQIRDKSLPKNPWYLLEVNRPLLVPVNKKVRFLVTANDVIHSWWVPELGIKRDAIPGFIHEAWAKVEKPGIYRGQCAELCGVYHGYMPIVVEAVPQAEFDAWLAAQKKMQSSLSDGNMTKDEAMVLGKKVYEQQCVACHKADGVGQLPTYPGLKGSSIVVNYPLSRNIDILLGGVPGSAMQAFGNQLTDTEIAAVITYTRNAFGNNTNDLIQAQDIKARREQ